MSNVVKSLMKKRFIAKSSDLLCQGEDLYLSAGMRGGIG